MDYILCRAAWSIGCSDRLTSLALAREQLIVSAVSTLLSRVRPNSITSDAIVLSCKLTLLKLFHLSKSRWLARRRNWALDGGLCTDSGDRPSPGWAWPARVPREQAPMRPSATKLAAITMIRPKWECRSEVFANKTTQAPQETMSQIHNRSLIRARSLFFFGHSARPSRNITPVTIAR